MELIEFNRETCTKCGHCAVECPVKIIELNGNGPEVVPERAGTCINCGHCVCVCPEAALTHKNLAPADCPPSGEAPSEADIERIIRRRRSYRSFKKEPVERETLERLIKIARYGPTGTNSQQISWVAIDNREGVVEVADHVIGWMKKLIKWRHPAAKNYGFKRIVMAQEAGMDVICRDATALVVTHAPKAHNLGTTDSAIALTSLDIAAPSLGLATCWGGFVMAAAGYHKPLVKHLEIPKGHVLTGAMLVGLPKFGYVRLPARNEPKVSWL